MEREEAETPYPSMQVLFVVDSLNVGGAERHVIDLASALAQRGHGVTLACSIEGALAPLAVHAGVQVRPLLRRLVKRRMSLRYAWELAKLIHRDRFDLMHAHMFASTLASACAIQGSGIPLVITEHSQATWRSCPAWWCSRWAYSQAKHVIAVSREIKRRLVEQDGVPFDRVSVIMNAVSAAPDQFIAGELNLLGVPRSCPLVGVAARLQPEKGVAYLLEAAATILRHWPQVHFLVIGDGPQRKTLQAYVKQLDVQKQVHFLGFRQDARAIVGSLDVLVVPSLSEGTPLVTLEAMAAGVPVVASGVGGIPEQIRHQCEGLLVPPANAQALGEAVLQLLNNPSRMQRLGQAGKQRVFSQFRLETMVQQTEDVYRTMLGWPARSAVANRVLEHPLAETGGGG